MGAPVVPRGAAAAPRPNRRPRPPRTSARAPARGAERARPTASSLAAACIAACAVGLAGVDGGLLWIVAGVFTLRSLTGAPPGLTWAVACLGAGLRWGTFALGDLESATRLVGSTIAAGSPVVQGGMIAALAAAVLDEARHPNGRTPWTEQSAAVVAAVTLAVVFVLTGPAELSASVVPWAAAAAATLVATILLRPFARRLPQWAPLALAVVGVVVAEVAL